jgi:hypothetical protein
VSGDALLDPDPCGIVDQSRPVAERALYYLSCRQSVLTWPAVPRDVRGVAEDALHRAPTHEAILFQALTLTHVGG